MGRLRGCLWLTAGLLVALVAGVVAFMALSRAAAQRSGVAEEVAQVDVVVAAGRSPVRTVLTADNLRVKQMPVNAAPEGALQQIDQALGKVTLVELYPDEVILAQRLVDPNVLPPDARMALALDGDKVLIAYSADDLLSKVGMLKAGDHVDLLATLSFPANRGGAGEAPASFSVLQNQVIAAVLGAPIPSGDASGDEPTAAVLTPALLVGGESPGRADAEVCEGCGRPGRPRVARTRGGAAVYRRAGGLELPDRQISDPVRGRALG